jgi:peptidoglycan pentaglycine glycine transferase (the first glycine)
MSLNSTLTLIKDQATWDDFIARQPFAQFTQSWNWGALRESLGQKVKRFAFVDEEGITIAGQFIFYPKRFMKGFWYAPRGPVIRSDMISKAKELLQAFFDDLPDQLDTPSFFIRCEPPIEIGANPSLPLSLSFFRSHAYQPASTSLIDLTKSEDEILAAMHEKTRYNIRLAERKGVIVRLESSEADAEAFFRLNKETAERDRFVTHAPVYIRQTYNFLSQLGMAAIRVAMHHGDILATNIEVRYGDTVTYLYGASSSEKRNFMAPFLLHWKAIMEAKEDGYRFYDMYGVNPLEPTSPYFKPSWEGITRFKLGWGGRRVDFIGTWELPSSPKIYRLARAVQKVVSRSK